jgi:hypothetical protein
MENGKRKKKINKNYQRRTPNGSMKLLQLGQMGRMGKEKASMDPQIEA